MEWFKRFTKRAVKIPPAAPDIGFHAIGDIHGCLPQLEALHAQLSDDLPIVCVGDYVDRGDDSAGVLQWLLARPQITCIKGNHEVMMLDFLDAPAAKGARWLRYGGLQTLASFGIGGVSERAAEQAIINAADALKTAMGEDMLVWLRNMPALHMDGNVAVVHAGADPELPIKMQSDKTLMWGHTAFENKVRTDGTWVVYGHTITPSPVTNNGRIGIDTGAYATGRLTAVTIKPDGQISFCQT